MGSVVVFFILLFIYTKFAGPIQFSINNLNRETAVPFEVAGKGRIAAAPDTALINLGITKNASTVLDAQNNANQISIKILDALKKLGIEEKKIKTTNYSVSPNYDFSQPTQRITGYTISQNFEVKAPIEKVNNIVDSATSNGANLVGGIDFALDDKKLEELRNQARKEAVDKAKADALGLANAAGIRLGKIINIRESFGGEIQPPVVLREAVGGDVQKEETNITPGETSVEVTVTLTYETF